jgi:hypothetical protein
MTSTLAVDQPKAILLAWESLCAPANGQRTQAELRPLLEVPISLTCISALPHPAASAKASRNSSLSTNTSKPATRSSAILVGSATLTVAGSKICAGRVASVDAFSGLCRRGPL